MENKLFSRREFLAATSLAIAGATLAACAPKATPTAAPAPKEPAAQPTKPPEPTPAKKEKVVLKYWVFWNQLADVAPLWYESDTWKEMKGDYEVEFKTGAGGDAGRTAVAAGTPPDVGDLGPQRDFMQGGKLLPLDDFIAASTIISPDKFFAENWADGEWQGTQYGIPAHECYVRRGLNYNEAMVQEAGLDPENPPQTWAELFEWHKKLTKFDAAGNLLQIGIDPFDAEGGTGPGGDGWTIADCWDFVWFDAATGTFNINNDRFVEGLDMYAEFYRHMGPDNLQGLRSVEGQGTWGGAFNAGVQAMIIEGYWHPGETAHEKPEISKVNRTTWTPVPEWRKGDKIQCFGGHVSSLFKDGEHAKEAFWILEFLQTDAACDPIFNTIGWLPALKDYIAKVDGSAFPGLDFYLKSATECTHQYGSKRCPIQTFASQKYREYREQVYRDEMTAKEAAERFQEDVENEWEESGWKEKWGQK